MEKIADKITRVSKTSPTSNSETNEEGIFRERYMFPELWQKIIDDLRLKEKKLKEENYWWSEINTIMEYEKIINLLKNTPNQPTKFRTKNWVEINDDSRGTYNTNSQIRFETSMLRSSLCDYSEAYILVSGTIKFLEQEIMMQRDDYMKEING